jgi:hypothetical protein
MIQKTLTRKDVAVSYTRKLVFDGPPVFDVSRHYRAVEDVVFFAPCLHEDEHSQFDAIKGFDSLRSCLKQLVANYLTSAPLHLTLHPRNKKQSLCNRAVDFLLENLTPAPITCDFHNVSMNKPLDLAYDFGAVVHFSDKASLKGEDADTPAIQLAKHIGGLFQYEEDEDNAPPGQIFLCNVTRLVLSFKELASSKDANDSARLKLFNLCSFSYLTREFTGSQSWDYFTSRVKLVDPGFKPSQADIAASVDRRLVNTQSGGHANN